LISAIAEVLSNTRKTSGRSVDIVNTQSDSGSGLK
jgi:hypothetical protein